jgi:hypothetical protein
VTSQFRPLAKAPERVHSDCCLSCASRTHQISRSAIKGPLKSAAGGITDTEVELWIIYSQVQKHLRVFQCKWTVWKTSEKVVEEEVVCRPWCRWWQSLARMSGLFVSLNTNGNVSARLQLGSSRISRQMNTGPSCTLSWVLSSKAHNLKRELYFRTRFVPRRKRCVTITKNIRLSVCREVTLVSWENHTKYKFTLLAECNTKVGAYI